MAISPATPDHAWRSDNIYMGVAARARHAVSIIKRDEANAVTKPHWPTPTVKLGRLRSTSFSMVTKPISTCLRNSRMRFSWPLCVGRNQQPFKSRSQSSLNCTLASANCRFARNSLLKQPLHSCDVRAITSSTAKSPKHNTTNAGSCAINPFVKVSPNSSNGAMQSATVVP